LSLNYIFLSSISFSKNYKTQSEKDRNDKNSIFIVTPPVNPEKIAVSVFFEVNEFILKN
jgi:hypothetical protein